MKVVHQYLFITECTIGVKPNLETNIKPTYLRYTIEMQNSFKRKLQTKNPSKDYLSLSQKHWISS